MYSNILAALSSTQIIKAERPVFEGSQDEKESAVVSREVLDEAIALAQGSGATLTLLHVLSEKEIQRGIQEFGNREAFDRECDRRVSALEDEVEKKGVDVINPDRAMAKIVSGDPGHVICDHAQRWKVDLIVVGRREKHFHLFHPGSVSKYVVEHAPCTTFVVNPQVASVSTEGSHPSLVL